MVALTLVVSITIVATGSFLVPFIRSNATDTLTELQARSIAESSINYVLALLNDQSTRADVDVSTIQPDCREISIDPRDLNLPALTEKTVKKIRVFVRNDEPTAPSGSIPPDPIFPLPYDPLVKSGVAGKLAASGALNPIYWRTLTALVEYGGDLNRGTYKFGLKVVAKPGLLTEPNLQSLPSGSSTPDSTFFSSPLAARNTISMGTDSQTIGSAQGSADGNLKAGGTVAIGDGVIVDGKIQLLSDSKIYIPNSNNYNSQLNNVIEYNSITPQVITPTPSITNLSSTDISPFTEGNSFPTGAKIVDISSSAPDPIPAPAWSPLPETPNFASWQGNGDYTIDASQLRQPSLPQLSSISGDTRLFLQNNGDINTPLEITANLGNASSANQLQLWYNGERPLVFKGGSQSLVVYAPYAKVTIGDGTKVTTFTGAVVASDVSIANKSTIKYAALTKGNDYRRSDFQFKANTGNDPYHINTIKWQIQSYKELQFQEFESESALTPRKT